MESKWVAPAMVAAAVAVGAIVLVANRESQDDGSGYCNSLANAIAVATRVPYGGQAEIAAPLADLEIAAAGLRANAADFARVYDAVSKEPLPYYSDLQQSVQDRLDRLVDGWNRYAAGWRADVLTQEGCL